jgi:transcription elongation factor GreA-like protein
VICPFCQKEIPAREIRMRSLPQLKYYWSVIVKILSDELGYTQNEMHEILKMMFLSELKIIKTKEGIKEIRIPKSTGECQTTEIEDYYSQIREFAGIDLGIFIPLPNEEIPDGL